MDELTPKQLILLVREHIKSAGTQKAFAKQAKMSEQWLCDYLHGRRNPGKELLKHLKLEQVTVYRPKGKSK